MPKGKNHEVICPGCRECYHLTTRKYNPNRDANAGMLELKAIYKSYGWDEPVPDPTAGYGILICPDCEAPLAPSGRLEVRELVAPPSGSVEEKEPIVITSDDKLPPLILESKGEIKGFVCPHCNREFKKKANLGSHMRVHKDKE